MLRTAIPAAPMKMILSAVSNCSPVHFPQLPFIESGMYLLFVKKETIFPSFSSPFFSFSPVCCPVRV